ncbi:oligosaccharide flippase family protein [Natronolimnohabitans sp. A-GB9]|uniref:oligosaccharide flippase family protein n=1 Tax=Natronolimnohabitans sp. A-GB9 TaxID=3069757 RepID=UPI0027B1507A|nr:oligosaccharide flippase family protein [Natronolimnohabitans sp. A-GB9]MDQ2052048.1 oligosaccharide flippase family protein [Natronolimnohabitans sp. A-GB9]
MDLTEQLTGRFKAEFLGRIVAIVSSGLLMVLLARLLGPDEYGLLFLAISVFSTVGIFSKLGIAKSGARYVSEYKEQRPDQLPHIFRTVLAFNVAAIVIVAVVMAVGHRQIATILEEPDLTPLLLLGALYLAFEALATYVRLMLQGLEEIKFSATVHAIDRGCRFVFAIGFVVLGFGAIGALVGYILAFALVTVIGLGTIYVRYYRDHAAAPSIEDGLPRRIGEYSVPLTATSTANVLDKEVDTVLVGFFLNPVAVSYYVISKQVIQFVETPATALGFTLSPTYGAQKANGNVDGAARIYETALSNTLLLYIPIAAGLALVAEPALKLVFGDEYLNAVPVLQVLAFYAVLQSITKLTSNGLDFLGRARERAIVKGTTAVMNVGLNIVLIPTIGVVGAAVATVVTYSLYTLANVYIIHLEFDLRVGYLVRRIALITAVTGVMAVVVFFAVSFVEGFLSLAFVIALGVAVWSTLSVLTGLLDLQQLANAL